MTCKIDGCGGKAHARGLCGMHYMRLLRTGSTERKPLSTTYSDVHSRLQRHRGSASEHDCLIGGCSTGAAVWAWMRTGPSREGVGSHGQRLTWGTDLADYAPMCQSHATMLDQGGTLTHCPQGHERAVAGAYSGGQCAQCGREAAQARRDREKVAS